MNDAHRLSPVAWLTVLWLGALAVPASAAVHKKFIELGWDIPTTAFLREHYSEMEQSMPFDGVMFKVEAKNEQGRKLSSEAIWDKTPWKRQWLEPALADLQACQFRKFTDNFVRFNATPGNLDWGDDAGWAVLTEKAGLCAWLMKAGHMKGLAVDFESYGANQFRFDAAAGPTFEQTAELVRKRGRQWSQAVGREFPNIVILTLWMNSINFRAGENDKPEAVLASQGYGLLPAFIDGMLDGAAPGMVFVDGCENGYYMDSAEEYLRAASGMRSWNGPAIRLVSPGNRAKYRQQVQAGFGFYLDMFINEEGHQYYRGPLEGSRLARLERNLGLARDAADEYVWIYGEQCRWWGKPMNLPKTVGKGRLWEEALPGITMAIAFARDPVSAAREALATRAKAGTLTNLAVNPQFALPTDNKPDALPKGFAAWQNEKEATGKFTWDGTLGEGAARARKVKWGCFIQGHPVKPGEIYAIEVDALARGRSRPTLVIRWQTAEQRWTHEVDDGTFTFGEKQGEWQKAFGVVTVPRDTGRLVILLNVNDQLTDEDVCWFDNLALSRLR